MERAPLVDRRWTRGEYARLLECGLLREGDPVELVAGRLVVKEPQHAAHATACRRVTRALDRAFGAGWDVRPGLPLALDPDSEPEPDVAVVSGEPLDYRAEHPSRPALVVEVSLARLAFDRRTRRACTRAPGSRSTGS